MKESGAWTSYKERVHSLSVRLVNAQKPIRIRDGIKWDEQTEQELIQSKFRRLPNITAAWYKEKNPLPYDAATKIEEFESIKRDAARLIGLDDPLIKILVRNCNEYQDSVRMLEGRGTPAFYEFSKNLYGSPKDQFDGDTTTLRDLGLLLYDILTHIPEDGLGAYYPKVLTAEQVVEKLNARFATFFHDDVVEAKLDDGIISDAAAGADYVKIRRGVLFSEKEVDLLEVHEGWVHVGTSINGGKQRVANWLAKGPPCTTAIQEGLAVLMEVITFTANPLRSKKLNNRILACDKVEDGADFLDIIEFYRTEGYPEKECLTAATRVFRGSLPTGGGPFTKDITYCKGFVMCYNFLRTAIRFGRPDLIPFLFCGKVTLDDVVVLHDKWREGVIDKPKYLAPQYRDLNGLAMWMAYSNFFNRVNLATIQEHYRAQMCR
jgi:uncharacterized protein (TIGR02421 family)